MNGRLFVIPFLLLLAILVKRRSPWLYAVTFYLYTAMPTLRQMIGPMPVYWCDIAGVAALVTALSTWRGMRFPLDKWARGFAGALFLGVLSSMARFLAILAPTYEYLRFVIAMSAIVVIPRCVTDKRTLKTLSWSVALVSATFAISAALQALSPTTANWVERFFYGDFALDPFGGYVNVRMFVRDAGNYHRVYGMYTVATTFGGATMMLVLCAELLREAGGRPLLLKLSHAASALTLLVTYSRHAILTYCGFFAIGVVLGRKRRVGAIIGTILLAVIGTSVTSVSYWGERFGKGGVTEDENLRTRLIDRPLELVERIIDDPLVLAVGAGFGLRRIEGIDPNASFGFASNTFLLYLFYCGLPAFLMVIALYWKMGRFAFRLRPERRGLGVGAVVSCILLLASDNYGFVVLSVWFDWAVVLGLVSTMAAPAITPQPISNPRVSAGKARLSPPGGAQR